MKKILLISLTSALPLTTLCNQANYILKSQSLLNGEWIDNEKIEEEKLFAPQLLKNKTNIYRNKQIEIDLIENYSSKTIAQIYAKSPQKKYQLLLKNSHIYNQETIKSFVTKKFYAEKTLKNIFYQIATTMLFLTHQMTMTVKFLMMLNEVFVYPEEKQMELKKMEDFRFASTKKL